MFGESVMISNDGTRIPVNLHDPSVAPPTGPPTGLPIAPHGATIKQEPGGTPQLISVMTAMGSPRQVPVAVAAGSQPQVPSDPKQRSYSMSMLLGKITKNKVRLL